MKPVVSQEALFGARLSRGVSDRINVSVGFEGFKYEAPNTLLCCLPFKSHWSLAEGDAETESQI